MKNFALELQLAASFLFGVTANSVIETTWALLLGFLVLGSVFCAKLRVLTLAHFFLIDAPEKSLKQLERPDLRAEVKTEADSISEQSTQPPESLPHNVVPLKKRLSQN